MASLICAKCKQETPRLWDGICPACYLASGKLSLWELNKLREREHRVKANLRMFKLCSRKEG